MGNKILERQWGYILLISRTPYRISFFGGGTDYPSWYEKHGGAALSTTIDKYCYITARYLPPFFDNKSRVVWNKIEEVLDNDDIKHPSIRACLQYLGITDGVEIHTTGDLPSRSGLGSSSTFTVGLLNALATLQGKKFNKAGLALEAVHLERDIMKENVGIQDQIASAYGGVNHTVISSDGSFFIKSIAKNNLEDYLLLFFTGISRTASEIAAGVVEVQNSGAKDAELHRMQAMVDEAIGYLENRCYEDFGHLLHESWMLKRSLAKNIAPPFVDASYQLAKGVGALGGKLLGAGGGGFMLFFVPPDKHEDVKEALKDLLHVPFKFNDKGSEIIYGL